MGGSVAINGCCTTAVEMDDVSFVCDLMEVTLEKTNLGEVEVGTGLNLERPMKLGDELGGHMVQGHVDAVGQVLAVRQLEASHQVDIRIPGELLRYVIATGSIAINGVSMTVARIEGETLTIGIIPHTWEVTNFCDLQAGSRVNLEVDMVGKYIEKMFPDRFPAAP
jgi:riboflavin synthase